MKTVILVVCLDLLSVILKRNKILLQTKRRLPIGVSCTVSAHSNQSLRDRQGNDNIRNRQIEAMKFIAHTATVMWKEQMTRMSKLKLKFPTKPEWNAKLTTHTSDLSIWWTHVANSQVRITCTQLALLFGNLQRHRSAECRVTTQWWRHRWTRS